MSDPAPATGLPGRARRALPLAALVASLAALPAPAQEPLSAIGWLSDSVALPVGMPPGAAALPEPPAGGAPTEPVDVTVLDTPAGGGLRDDAGLVTARAAGLPAAFWGATPADVALRLIATEPEGAVPALRDLLHAVLVAGLAPPADAAPPGAVVLARIDRLLDLGALDDAAALVEAAGPITPDLFRRLFDAALLTGAEDAACARLRDAPGVAPALPTRIFCLARGGDWAAAALTFDTALALGQVTGDEAAVLARFLDPDGDDGAAPLAAPARVTPLVLRLYEAIGEPIATQGLPLAFAHADLRATTGWKGQIEAAERLVRHGALPPARLWTLYRERLPAASGGVWDRVEAIQRLDAALDAGDPAGVARRLPAAWAAMQAADLEVAFAATYADRLARLPLTGAAAGLAFRAALLGPAADRAPLPADAGPEERFLAALAQGRTDGVPGFGSLGRAIAPAFAADPLPPPPEIAALLASDRTGEAVLRAVALIGEGAAGDLRGVTAGLAALRQAGLEAAARHAAVQLLVLERRG